jgi:hypothetical protein
MKSLHGVPRGQESEALYWLAVAKRVLSGDIDPDEARHVLKSGTRRFAGAETTGERPASSAAGQSSRAD